MRKGPVQFGIDHFLQTRDPGSQRIALVTNNAATTSQGVLSRVALLKAGYHIVKLFSPEHGLTAQGADGVHQTNSTDPVTGLPVISLYGDRLVPAEEDLTDTDLVLYDIPDAGCRFYTYLWTLTYVMEACEAYHTPLIILDRPNPISGDLSLAEGPMLDETTCASFIGRYNIPVRHSCTTGELANYFAQTRTPSLEYTIRPVTGWDRNDFAPEAGWLFVPTSPGIPDPATALLYPGMGLLEGIRISEGRGTTLPFKICGAPWIDATRLQEMMAALSLPGVACLPYTFRPEWGLYAGEWCGGLQWLVTDPRRFRPVQTALQLISRLLALYPEKIAPRLYSTAANPTGQGHLDKLTGVPGSLAQLQQGQIPETAVAAGWQKIIAPFLLYGTAAQGTGAQESDTTEAP